MAQKVNVKQQGTTELGYAEASSSQGGITTTITDLTSLSTTVTIVAGDTIVIEVFIPQLYSTVNADRIDLHIREGTTSLAISYNEGTTSALGWGGAITKARLQPSAGSHTYKASLVRGAGSGTLSTYAAADTKAYIQVIRV